jgi:basic membrane lipoprotein Med (substrate-binding protein (PBP1-ABC) superfamily)
MLHLQNFFRQGIRRVGQKNLYVALKNNGAGIHAFGQSADMSSFGPKAHLASLIDNWGPFYVERVKAVLDGT